MRHFFYTSIAILSLVSSLGETWACSIESGLTPMLAAYMKNVEASVSKIRSFASANNACNGSLGTFSNEARFLSAMNRIDALSPLSADIVTDFSYSLMLTVKGEARNPVMTQGKILQEIETLRITPALKSVASACALDIIMDDGQTPKEALSTLLDRHRTLESYYKNIALGDTRTPENLEEDIRSLYDEIRDNYSPHATASCKGAGEVGNLEDLMGKIQSRIDQKAARTHKSQDTWQAALDLFAGKGTNTLKYQALQKKLLGSELARQGLTSKAAESMIGNLTCFQRKTTPDSTTEDMGRARIECMSNVVIGLENLTNPFRAKIRESTYTQQYLNRILAIDTAKIRLGSDMGVFWSNLEKTKNTDEKQNEKIITDLVEFHAKLTLTNELLRKKIPIMYENCRKGQPSIPCPDALIY